MLRALSESLHLLLDHNGAECNREVMFSAAKQWEAIVSMLRPMTIKYTRKQIDIFL